MPLPNEQSRPGRGGSETDPATDVDAILPNADEIAAQLRRRREASKRMPALSSGRRDPWDLESYYDRARGA